MDDLVADELRSIVSDVLNGLKDVNLLFRAESVPG